MPTEEDFQNSLDERIDDWQLRLIFADWLEEHGDPRAEGYRALGTLRLYPDMEYSYRFVHGDDRSWRATDPDRSVLPTSWFVELDYYGKHSLEPGEDTRRQAEDKAAMAFAAMTTERKVWVLSKAVIVNHQFAQ